MNNIKTRFSIRDLENLSGIKAHTIRIWEKRYAILSPMRTETNIRFYDSGSLQKLLNVALLHSHGYKISKIATFPTEKIPTLVRQIVSQKSAKSHAINAFKMAMMNFDQPLFFNTYNSLLAEKSFREVFYEVFLPLMDEIGLLWQSETVTPAHEHFISNLIRQKVLTNTEKIQVVEPLYTDKVFVLFLPELELHELGLMYLNYEITLHGHKTVYLGESVPSSNLIDVKRLFSNIVYVTYFTVEPQLENLTTYVERLYSDIMDDSSELWILGRRSGSIDPKLRPRVKLFQSIASLVNNL
jgi:DNA-binding transcriptional MerR regulator